MIPAIPSIPSVLPSGEGNAAVPRLGANAATPSFATELSSAIAHVENSAKASCALTTSLLRGENVELHQVAVQAQEAQISFELLLQVRNKLIQGYQEIMRMQL